MTHDARWRWSTTAAFLALWVVVYGGASALSAHVPWQLSVALPGEAHLPLVRAASIPYLSLDLLLLALPLTLRRWAELAPVAGALAAQTLVAGAVFVVLPVRAEPWLEPTASDPLFALADAMNLERNYLPSLHVSYALTAASVLAGRAAGPARLGYAAWGLSIAASTVLLRQHYLADVAAGAALAWATRRWVEPRVDADAVRVELQCLLEMARFTLRHRRYGTIAVVLLAASVPAWRARRVLRAGYCFLQLVDDWLDGDRACDEEPLDRVAALRAEIASRRFADRPASWLAAAVVADLAPPDVERLSTLLATMAVDRRRRLVRAVWDAPALAAHHRATFGGSVDLLLAGVRSEARAEQVPDVLDAFGVVSTLRDLREDLASGLCNVPAEVVGPTPWDGIERSPAFARWRTAEIERARAALARAEAELGSVDPPARAALRPFLSSMRARLDRAAADGLR